MTHIRAYWPLTGTGAPTHAAAEIGVDGALPLTFSAADETVGSVDLAPYRLQQTPPPHVVAD